MPPYFRIDPHVHTSEVSVCGKVSAEEMVRLYHRAGYQGFMVTDHYYSGYIEQYAEWEWTAVMDAFLEGYHRAAEAARPLGMDILLGMEIRFEEGPEDYLVFGFDPEFLYRHPHLYRQTLDSFRNRTRNKGILIFQAHPFRRGMTAASPSLIDGIEAFNGNPRHDSCNHLAYAYGREAGLLLLSGSDAHQPQDVGNGAIAFPERITTGKDLAAWLYSEKPYDLIHRG